MNTTRASLAVALCLLLGISGVLLSEERFDHKVRSDYFAGFLGDRAALDRAMKITESTLAASPRHAEAMVWHGSGVFFLAGQALQRGDREEGMKLSAQGVRMMDEAVALAPDNVGVRIPRGAVLMTSARFMGGNPFARSLQERALSDYMRAYELQKDHLDKLGAHPRGELLFGLADTHSRLGNHARAQEFFETIARDLKDTPYARRAAAWLETRTPLPAAQAGCIGCHVAK